ncbi:hypothetical protein, partial [Escherichia coli]|uniref:hypothetical protein n=3 Tax=Escherichia coli TaxID=562 RepID=UPI0030C6ABFA
PRRLLMKSAILWRISRLFSWAVTTSYRAAETGDTGQAVEAACQPARKPLAGWRLPEGKRATLARRPLPFPSVMCLTQECFFLMLWNCS